MEKRVIEKVILRISATIIIIIALAIIFMFLTTNTKTNKENNDFQQPGQDSQNQTEPYYLAGLDNEERIKIGLPYKKEDTLTWIMPMGETYDHPILGHPGFDFYWNKSTSVIAVTEGEIYGIKYDDSKKIWDLTFKAGNYFFDYWSLANYNPELKVGYLVKKGDILGQASNQGNIGRDNLPEYMIHWDMRPAFEFSERLCPITYFDEESRKIIEEVWIRTDISIYNHKDEFLLLCNRQYEHLNSFEDIKNWEKSEEREKLNKEFMEWQKSNQ